MLRDSQDLMKKGKFSIQGNRLIGNITMEEVADVSLDSEYSISGGTTTIQLDFAKDNMLCDFNFNYSVKGATFRAPNKVQVLGKESSVTKGSCLPSVTKSELKKLDLTKIAFCDETGNDDEQSCEEKDMSFLISDL